MDSKGQVGDKNGHKMATSFAPRASGNVADTAPADPRRHPVRLPGLKVAVQGATGRVLRTDVPERQPGTTSLMFSSLGTGMIFTGQVSRWHSIAGR
jgi:hypothetical protein